MAASARPCFPMPQPVPLCAHISALSWARVAAWASASLFPRVLEAGMDPRVPRGPHPSWPAHQGDRQGIYKQLELAAVGREPGHGVNQGSHRDWAGRVLRDPESFRVVARACVSHESAWGQLTHLTVTY